MPEFLKQLLAYMKKKITRKMTGPVSDSGGRLLLFHLISHVCRICIGFGGDIAALEFGA
jgi:hypothetical protein